MICQQCWTWIRFCQLCSVCLKVLGPLLCLTYINDLHYTIKASCSFHFADDTCFLTIQSSVKQINRTLDKDFPFVECKWYVIKCYKNRLFHLSLKRNNWTLISNSNYHSKILQLMLVTWGFWLIINLTAY